MTTNLAVQTKVTIGEVNNLLCMRQTCQLSTSGGGDIDDHDGDDDNDDDDDDDDDKTECKHDAELSISGA